MHLFRRLFYKPKHSEKTTSDCSIYRILAPSIISIFICAVCLCGASWAWFTASASTGTTAIQAASYTVNVAAENESVKIATEGGISTVTFTGAGRYAITLTPSGTASAGYCKINFANVDDYTEQLSSGSLRFTVCADADSKLTITPQWGCYSGTATIHNNTIIPATGSQSSNTQTPYSIATTKPSAEPAAPTTPTAPTTPSSTPTESETTTPEPSATTPTPTQPETTDTEPAPAPEDTTPAAYEPTDTTSDPTE